MVDTVGDSGSRRLLKVAPSRVYWGGGKIMPCVLIAAPLREGAGKVKLAGREMSLTPPQSALVVSSLPNPQVARALADKIRDRSDIVAKYTETVR